MTVNKVNIVFGVNGQIGSYLAEYLLSLNEKVVGIVRRSSLTKLDRLNDILNHSNFSLQMADITDSFSLLKLFSNLIVDKNVEYVIYNLAAQSQVHVSFSQPGLTTDVTGIGHLNILETLLAYHKLGFKIKTFFMASSEMYGSNRSLNGYQNLNVPFAPNSPYALAKLFGYHINRIYRESYSMFTTAGIIFNTESPRRSEEFVTRKITKWFAEFMANNYKFVKGKLKLGNVSSYRDWTHARDTVRAIYLIANNAHPQDYVVSSGETHSIYDFMNECYKLMVRELDKPCPFALEDLFEVDTMLFRPNEVSYLKGDSSAIQKDWGWKPLYNFHSLVEDMLLSDYNNVLKSEHQHEIKVKI